MTLDLLTADPQHRRAAQGDPGSGRAWEVGGAGAGRRAGRGVGEADRGGKATWYNKDGG